jgi:TetR/AcrR family transcriptional regulator, cholesterol catabolism regulator
MDNRQRIIEDAAVMFRTYGIRAVTMDMIAGQMGISKRTIYENFSDKEELLSGVLQMMAVKQKELTVKVFSESENVIEAVFRLFNMMNEHSRNMSPAFRLDMEKYHNDIIKRLKEKDELPYSSDNSEMLRRGIKEGVFRKDLNIEMTNKCLLEVIRMSNTKETFSSDEVDKGELFRNFLINYMRGISTPKGLDLINFYNKKWIKTT